MVHIGINLTDPLSYQTLNTFIDQKKPIHFCEILLDNFLHLDPQVFATELNLILSRSKTPVQIGFHLMGTKFIENDLDILRVLAKKIRHWITHLHPLYVSDHLACFKDPETQIELPRISELDYSPTTLQKVLDRTNYWQDLLGVTLHLENFPSIFRPNSQEFSQASSQALWQASWQPSWIEALCEKTGAKLLFDVSNSVCAQLNTQAPLEGWLKVVQKYSSHWHIAGFSKQNGFFLDSHDTEIQIESLEALKFFAQHCGEPKTLSVERDQNIEAKSWFKDILECRKILCSNQSV